MGEQPAQSALVDPVGTVELGDAQLDRDEDREFAADGSLRDVRVVAGEPLLRIFDQAAAGALSRGPAEARGCDKHHGPERAPSASGLRCRLIASLAAMI